MSHFVRIHHKTNHKSLFSPARLLVLVILCHRRREEKLRPVAQKIENTLPNINCGDTDHTKHTKIYEQSL